MEGNDIGFTVHKHVACMFEGLLMRKLDVTPEEQRPRGLFRRRREVEDEPLSEEEFIRREVRLWRPNELPLKSVIHMTTKMGMGVEVYTFLDPILLDAVEHWLSRKGADVTVYNYYDIRELHEDFKLNRDVHTIFTSSEEDARLLGIRSTVVLPDGTFGI